MKSVSVYQRKATTYVHPQNETVEGLWILATPVTSVGNEASDEETGRVIEAALKQSKQGVRHPSVWTGLTKPLFERAKVRSWSEFVKGARSCSVESDGEQLKFIPYRNLGPRGGFTAIGEKALSCSSTESSQAIGALLRAALSLAE